MPVTLTDTNLSFSLPGLMGSNPGPNWIVLLGVITNCAISYFIPLLKLLFAFSGSFINQSIVSTNCL